MKQFDDFIDIVKRLRAPDGCPWDKEQTFESLTPHIIEEAYELADTMSRHDMDHLREELGDVLLHVVMLANMAEEEQAFSILDVVTDISDKMVRRHPHVFGDGTAETVDDVWENWEKIKKTEKPSSTFDSIPKNLPALMLAQKYQKKAARFGFDWPDLQGAREKLSEELSELNDELKAESPDIAKIQEELGDVLFAVVNISRKLGVDAETALGKTNQKFVDRLCHMESAADAKNMELHELSLDSLEDLWQQAKK